MLYLFDATGLGVAANDDFSGVDPQLSFASLPAGDDFLAVTGCCIQPISTLGDIFPNVAGVGQILPTGPGASSPVIGWTADLWPGDLPYTITFSSAVNGAQIPEPATLALFGLGLAGLGTMRRRKLAA